MDNRTHFLSLFLQHQTDLTAFIRSLVPRRDDAEDLLQETALICWEKFDEFDRSRSFGAWARGVASNKIRQYWTKDSRLPTPFSPEAIESLLLAFDDPSAESSPPAAEALEHCVTALRERGRQLLRLRYGESLSVAELAPRVAMSPEAAQKALFRVRKRLAECIRRRLGDSATIGQE